jgi:hypothetical protein
MKAMAYLQSLQDKKNDRHVAAEVEIIEHIDDNNVIAEYNGVRCHGIFNWFVCAYFVDDVYAVIGGEANVDADQPH